MVAVAARGGRQQKPNMNGNSTRNSVDDVFSVIHFQNGVYSGHDSTSTAMAHTILALRLRIGLAFDIYYKNFPFGQILMKICHLWWAINGLTATFPVDCEFY